MRKMQKIEFKLAIKKVFVKFELLSWLLALCTAPFAKSRFMK